MGRVKPMVKKYTSVRLFKDWFMGWRGAQAVECLSSKHEAVSSNPGITKNKTEQNKTKIKN
jgi:hypothetical protein